jgi:predicted RNA methylase
MNIPNLPHMSIPITLSSGQVHPDWYKYFNQLTNELQINVSQEGTSIPAQSTSNISSIEANLKTPTLIYDSDLKVPKISVNGVFKTITTS